MNKFLLWACVACCLLSVLVAEEPEGSGEMERTLSTLEKDLEEAQLSFFKKMFAKSMAGRAEKEVTNEPEVTTVPEKDFMTVPEKDFMTVPEKDFMTVPEKDFMTVPEKDFMTVPEKDFMTVPEKDFMTVPEKDFMTVPEKDFMTVPEKDFMTVPEKDFMTVPEKDFMTVPEKDFMTVPEKDFTTVPEKDFTNVPEKDMVTIVAVPIPVDNMQHNASPSPTSDLSYFKSDAWAQAFITEHYPKLKDQMLRGGADGSQVRKDVASAVDLLVQSFLSAMVMSDQVLCIFSLDMAESMNLLLEFEMISAQTALTESIAHEVLHSAALPAACAKKVTDGDLPKGIYDRLYQPIIDMKSNVKSLIGGLIGNESDVDREQMIKDIRAYLQEKVDYNAHEAILKVFSIKRKFVLAWMEAKVHSSEHCDQLAKGIKTVVMNAANMQSFILDSEQAIEKIIKSAVGEECKLLQSDLVDSIHKEDQKIFMSPRTLVKGFSVDLELLCDQKNMIKQELMSSLDRVFEYLFDPSKSNIRKENLKQKIVAKVLESSPVNVSSPARDLHLQHMHVLADVVISQMGQYFPSDCLSAQVVAMLIGLIELKGMHLQSLPLKNLVYVSNHIWSLIHAEHRDIQSSVRNELQRDIHNLASSYYHHVLMEHVAVMRKISLDMPTEALGIELSMLPTHPKEDTFSVQQMVEHVAENLVELFSKMDSDMSSKCKESEASIFDEVMDEINRFDKGVESLKFLDVEAVSSLLEIDSYQFKFSDEMIVKIQKILHSNLQMSVPPVFNDYITLAGDLKKSPESKNWVIAKFTANAIALMLYEELHPNITYVQCEEKPCTPNLTDINVNLQRLVSWQHASVTSFTSSYMEGINSMLLQVASSSGVELCTMAPGLCMDPGGLSPSKAEEITADMVGKEVDTVIIK